MTLTVVPAPLESDADIFASELSVLAESLGNEVSITYILADLAHSAENLPVCVELETQHGIISIIEDRYSRTWMCCERGTKTVITAIRVDASPDPESLMDIGSRFLSGVD